MTPTETLINNIVDYQIEIMRISKEAMPFVQDRFRSLLQNPDQMNDELAAQFLESEMSMTDLPVEFWDTVAEAIEMGFDELHSVPIMERGEAWEIGRGMVVAIAQRQALLESGAIHKAMMAGVPLGLIKRDMIDKIDVAELQQTAQFKRRIKEKLNAEI
jgi:hypothetical protein